MDKEAPQATPQGKTVARCEKCSAELQAHNFYRVHYKGEDRKARHTLCQKCLNGPWRYAQSDSGAYGGIERVVD